MALCNSIQWYMHPTPQNTLLDTSQILCMHSFGWYLKPNLDQFNPGAVCKELEFSYDYAGVVAST